MQESASEGPSLIKLGKLANSRKFDELETNWISALENPDYTWRELVPIAGQVGRQGAGDRADALLDTMIGWVEEKSGHETALETARQAAGQLASGSGLRQQLLRLYSARYGDYSELADLLELIIPADAGLVDAVQMMDLYVQLKPGDYVMDLAYLVPGIVETVTGKDGGVVVRFDDRRQEYDLSTATKLSPRSAEFFPALVLYDPQRLRDLAKDDAVEFVKMALRSNRDGRFAYRDLKGHVVELLGEKGWKSWWLGAKVALKRDPLIGMSAGSQPTFRLLRQADRYEDRLRREFDHRKDPLEKLMRVMNYLDELAREERQSGQKDCADDELLAHFGNGAAKAAVAVLRDDPSLALAGLALHAEIAARGVAVPRPNPKAAAQVLAKIPDAGVFVSALPEALLQRVLTYLRQAIPERWGEVWGLVALRAGKRLCDQITRGLIEGDRLEDLSTALRQAMAKPSASPDLLCWLWRTRYTSGAGGKFLEGLENVSETDIANAMFSLLDSTGKLYGVSMEERHLKVLENARAALSTQSSQPLLALLERADRAEAIRLQGLIRSNAGLSAAQRTQLLGFLRSRYADIFMEVTREWEDSGTIYTTEDGLRKTQEALNFIIEVEIPEVAKQIGEAASFGDLSENAEFTAALEKRDQLASRATALETDLNQATVITRSMTDSNFVNVGTRVVARVLDTGDEEVFTFLGPWDTDTDQKVLNYQAPLSLAFMGTKVGGTVNYGEDDAQRSWEIVKIEPAF